MKTKLQHGNVIVILLFFMVIAITITSASIAIVAANSLAATKYQESVRAQFIAESGIENALLRLLRDPNYTGETLSVDSGTATITVSGSSVKTITSVATSGNFTKTLVITAQYSNNILTVTSWTEQ